MLCHCVVCESLFVYVCVAGLHPLIVCSVADLLVRLFVVGRIGGCGLRETHAGLPQSVSDSPGACSDCVLFLLNMLLSFGRGR